MYNKFKLGFRLILLFLFLGTSATYAQNLITVSFSDGFVGNNTGTNSSGNSYYLSALGWSKVQFAQNSTGNAFVESAQGNDIIGMVIITDANGIQHTIDGFVKWRAPSGSVTTLVFQPSSNATLATNSANGSATYTINNTKYIGLTFNGSTLTIPNSGANAGEVTGNAATNGLLELLNSYLDAQPKITIAGAGLNVSESVGNAVITLNLSVAASTSVSVNYTTADSTAIAGLDYTTTSGTATFAPGQTTKTFSVPIIDDNTSESSEIIKVIFSGPVNASLVGNMAFINIADNENTDNTAPVITGPNGSGTTTGANSFKSIPENTTAVFSFTANEPVTWSISGGIDQAKFNINPTTGLVTFVVAPDFENPTDNDGNNTYIVIIEATDAAGNVTTQTLTVTVTDVDEVPPVITGPNGSGTTTGSNSFKSIPENTTAVYTFTANEPVTWSINGGVDAAKFSIDPVTGAVTFVTAPDFENPTDNDGNNTYIIIIEATDDAGNITTQTLTVTVTKVDNVPPVITGPNGSGTTTGANSFKSIPENTTAVYTFTANEPVTWSISGGIDQAKFNINPTTGLVTFVDAPDFDNPTDNDGNNTYIVIIQASDAAGNTITQTLTVTVLKDFDGDGNPDIDDTDDDNDGIPDIDELDCSASTGISQSLNPSPFYFVQWNSFTNGVLSGTINIAGDIVNVTVTNSMNSIISYGGAPFGGTGNWAPAPTSGDGSAGTFYSYTEGEHKFVFDRPVNNPRFFINSLNRTLDLSLPGKILSSNGAFTGTPTGSTTSVLVGNEANGTISFTGNVTEVSFTGRAREYYCTFSLGVSGLSDFSSCVDKDTDGDGTPDRLDGDSDGDGVTDAQERLDGTDPYDLCSFVLANQTQTPSAAWNTTDCDSDGVDNLTEVNQGTDPLVANPPPVITGPNGAGTTTGANAYKSIPENTTAVYTYTADRTVTWSINGGVDAAKFIIDSTTGVVSFVNPPDFENPTDANTNNTYIVVIKARDNNGFVSTQTLTVTVTDVVENLAPTDITLSKLAIYEGNALDAIVGVLSSTDPNAGDTHTYALVNGAGSDHNDFFSIQGNQLRAGMVFNFNNQLLYSIRIRTTDAGGLSYEKIFLIEILKAPYAVGSGNISGPGQITASGYNVTISKGLSAPLNILGNGLVSYSWSPSIGLSANNIANPVANPLQTTTYAVTVTNNQGVSTVVYVTVTVVEDYNVKPNTVITPNGDGKNDQWVISNLLTYPNNRVQVYDKAGRLLLSKTNYQNDWDGSINGSPLAEGTYYYVIKFDVPQQQIIKGYLTIIRD